VTLGGEAGPSGAGGSRKGGQQQQQPEAGPRPDRRGDYKAWVAWQKQKWRQVRQERKRRKVESTKRSAQAAREGPQAVSAALVGGRGRRCCATLVGFGGGPRRCLGAAAQSV